MGALSIFFSGPGQTFSISTFIDYYLSDFDISRSLISSIYAGATIASGSLLFLVGRLVDRFGLRWMTVAVGLLLAAACFGNAFVIGPVTLFVGFFFLRLFGQGSLTLLPNTLVPQWFIKGRGKALSLVGLGGLTAAAILPPLNIWLIETWGWSHAWHFWGICLLLIFVPMAYFLIRDRPEQIGLLPDGVEAGTGLSTPVGQVAEHDWSLGKARETRAFWLMLYCVSVPSLINTGVVFHMISIMGEREVGPAGSAVVLSVMALSSFPATLLGGYLADRYWMNVLLSVGFLLYTAALFSLQFVSGMTTAIAFGLVLGLTVGLVQILSGVVWPNYFGRRYLGSIKGMVMTAMVLASAFGPLPLGFAFDIFGGYSEALYMMIILPFLAIFAAYYAPKPTPSDDDVAGTSLSA